MRASGTESWRNGGHHVRHYGAAWILRSRWHTTAPGPDRQPRKRAIFCLSRLLSGAEQRRDRVNRVVMTCDIPPLMNSWSTRIKGQTTEGNTRRMCGDAIHLCALRTQNFMITEGRSPGSRAGFPKLAPSHAMHSGVLQAYSRLPLRGQRRLGSRRPRTHRLPVSICGQKPQIP